MIYPAGTIIEVCPIDDSTELSVYEKINTKEPFVQYVEVDITSLAFSMHGLGFQR